MRQHRASFEFHVTLLRKMQMDEVYLLDLVTSVTLFSFRILCSIECRKLFVVKR